MLARTGNSALQVNRSERIDGETPRAYSPDVFGFDIGTIPRWQIQLASKRTALLESSLDDPTLRIPWFQNLQSGGPPADAVPLSQVLDWTKPRRLDSLPKLAKDFLYAKIGDEDAMAFPELLTRSIVRSESPGRLCSSASRRA